MDSSISFFGSQFDRSMLQPTEEIPPTPREQNNFNLFGQIASPTRKKRVRPHGSSMAPFSKNTSNNLGLGDLGNLPGIDKREDPDGPTFLLGPSQEDPQFSQGFNEHFGQRLSMKSVDDSTHDGGTNQGVSNLCYESEIISSDGFQIPISSQSMYVSFSKLKSTHMNDPKVNKENRPKNSPPMSDDDCEINIQPPIINPFLSHDTLPPKVNPTKIWIKSFKEWPRYFVDFHQEGILGQGTSSIVYCARRRIDGVLYAVKKLKSTISTEGENRVITKEVCAHAALQGCPYIVQYFNSWIDDGQLYIQTELCSLGTLDHLIEQKTNRLDPYNDLLFHHHMVSRTDSFDLGLLSSAGRSKSFNMNMIANMIPPPVQNTTTTSTTTTSTTTCMNNNTNNTNTNNHTINALSIQGLNTSEMDSSFLPIPSTHSTDNMCDNRASITSTTTSLFSQLPPRGRLFSMDSQYSQGTIPSGRELTRVNSIYGEDELMQSSTSMMDTSMEGPLIDELMQSSTSDIHGIIGTSNASKTATTATHLPNTNMNTNTTQILYDTNTNVSGTNQTRVSSQLHQHTLPTTTTNTNTNTNTIENINQVSSTINGSSISIYEHALWLIMNYMATAIHFMHQKGVAHMDIRPANIFLAATAELSPNFMTSSSNNTTTNNTNSLFNQVNGQTTRPLTLKMTQPQNNTKSYTYNTILSPTQIVTMIIKKECIVKLGDFGLSIRINNQHNEEIEEGESRYLAREVINGNGLIDLKKADIFSFGASMYEMALGRQLGAGGDEGSVEWHNIRDGQLDDQFIYSGKFSTPFLDILTQMIYPEPSQRPSAYDIIQYTTHYLSSLSKPSSSSSSSSSQ